MLLFVQVDMSKLSTKSHESFLIDLVATCLENQIDGVVLRQTLFDPEAENCLKLARKAAGDKLIIISEGRKISTAEQVNERLSAGATLATTCDPFFLRGPYAIYDIKK